MFPLSLNGFSQVARALLLTLAAFVTALPTARAGLTFTTTVNHFNANGDYEYTIAANITTNSLGTNLPYGTYFLVSPGYPVSYAYHGLYIYDTNGFNFNNSGSLFYPDFPSMMAGMTNGNWTLYITNQAGTSVTTNTFTLSAPTLSSNNFPLVTVTFPTNGSVISNTMPTLAWIGGSTNFEGVDIRLTSAHDNSFYAEVLTAVTVNSWQFSDILAAGAYNFFIGYNSQSNNLISATAPVDSSTHVAMGGWVYTTDLETSYTSQFTVSTPPQPSFHTLVLHYNWNGTNTDVFGDTVDLTGNGNSISFASGGGPTGGVTITNDALEGNQAVAFGDADNISLGALGLFAPQPVFNALSGSFTVSCWIKTTQTFSDDNAPAYNGAGIFSMDDSGLTNDLVPMALTGSKIGFNTGGSSDDTINSHTSVNDGHYHLITVTRDQTTGAKAIYIDGQLDITGVGTTNLLNAPQVICLGAIADSTQADVHTIDVHNGFGGDMDDLQVYSGVLNAAEVNFLFHNAGQTSPNISASGIVAHYMFDNPNFIGADSSGNGADLDYSGGNGVQISYTVKAGGGAAYFDGGSYLSFTHPPTNVMSAFASDFTLSVWVLTTQTAGDDNDNAFAGAGIVAADVPAQVNDIIPMALTGGAIGFNTGPNDDSLNSTIDINDGFYHHIVVTRSRSTGQKQLYIDSVLNTNDFATTNLLNAPLNIGVGSGIDASKPGPANFSNGQFFNGTLDDMQIYSRVLSVDEINYLFNNPGAEAGSPVDFNSALNTTNLVWSTSGSPWFVEATNSSDGISAAQSGVVTNNDYSTLSLTVTGPGTISFYWQTSPNGDQFDFEFDIDSNYTDDIGYGYDWYQDGPFNIPSGIHTLTWTAYAYGDTDPTEAAYLDQVSYISTPQTAPINPITLTSGNVSGGNYQFSFTSTTGHTNYIQSRTNLSIGTWQPYTNFAGDGTLKTFLVPVNSSKQQFFRVDTQ